MIKRGLLLIVSCLLFFLIGCSDNRNIEISDIIISHIDSSIGYIGNDTTISKFSYTIHLTNNSSIDMKIISLEPIIFESFENKILSEKLIIEVNEVIFSNEYLEVQGEILFDSKNLSKEQIIGLEHFVREIIIVEERVIKKSF